MARRPPHPSGKPIREPKIGVRSIWRIPDKGPIIPRLQHKTKEIEAIGFMANMSRPLNMFSDDE